jgi:dCTP deaminase
MILSGDTLRESIKNKDIVLEPIDDGQIQPASVDLRLSDDFLVMEEYSMDHIDMGEEVKYKQVKSDSFVLLPKSFVLARTKEYMEIPLDCAAAVEGRSSIGRIGLFIQNAGWIDPGFKGTITLELFNASNVPIRLKPGRRVGQLVVSKLDKKLEKGYQGKYLGQMDTTGSRINNDYDVKKEE